MGLVHTFGPFNHYTHAAHFSHSPRALVKTPALTRGPRTPVTPGVRGCSDTPGWDPRGQHLLLHCRVTQGSIALRMDPDGSCGPALTNQPCMCAWWIWHAGSTWKRLLRRARHLLLGPPATARATMADALRGSVAGAKGD
jgi:hypothetical protein